MEINKLILKNDFALTADETKKIDLHIDDIIEKHRLDSQELSRMVLESTSLITAVESRSNGMLTQGIFSRLWNGFTGKNHKLSSSNQRDMAKAQYLSQEILNKLFEQNLVQFEMIMNIEHKFNILAQDILDTNQNLFQVCNVISAFLKKQKKINAEMIELRKNDDLLFWERLIRHEEVFQGKTYSRLAKEQQIVCIANAFYTISKGRWNDRDLLLLKSVMREDVGLEPDETVIPAHVLKAMSENDALLDQFFRKTGYDISALSPELAGTPFSACLAKLKMLEGEENYHIQSICEFTPEISTAEIQFKMALKYIQQQTGRNLEKGIPCFDMILELINDLYMIQFFITPAETAVAEDIESETLKNPELIENNSIRSQVSHQQTHTDTKKNEQKEDNLKSTEKNLSDFFNTLKREGININEEQKKRIVEKMTNIITYEPVVGIFGKTGVGKSSLCNALFGQDIAKISDVSACTREVQEIALSVETKGIKLFDVPGIAESEDKDNEYADLYENLLPELDVVLWLLKGDERAFSLDEKFYKKIVKPHLNDRKPFFIVINQIDKIEPFREWDLQKNEPGLNQNKNILNKKEDVSQFFDLPVSQIIPISANEKYNLTTLVDEIVYALPKDKKISFAKNVLGENVSDNARNASNESFKDILSDFFEDKVKIPVCNATEKVWDGVKDTWDTVKMKWFYFWL